MELDLIIPSLISGNLDAISLENGWMGERKVVISLEDEKIAVCFEDFITEISLLEDGKYEIARHVKQLDQNINASLKGWEKVWVSIAEFFGSCVGVLGFKERMESLNRITGNKDLLNEVSKKIKRTQPGDPGWKDDNYVSLISENKEFKESSIELIKKFIKNKNKSVKERTSETITDINKMYQEIVEPYANEKGIRLPDGIAFDTMMASLIAARDGIDEESFQTFFDFFNNEENRKQLEDAEDMEIMPFSMWQAAIGGTIERADPKFQ